MSKLINEMLKSGDERLVLIVSDQTCVPHKKSDFHSFYYPYADGLREISDWGYNNAIQEKRGTMYGLLKDSEFIEDVPVDTSTYLFDNGFSFDGRKWKKETEKGSIKEGWNGRQNLVWNITLTDDDGEQYQSKVHLDVTNSSARFLPVLDQLLSLDPIKDCGLTDYRNYQIRYERGSVGLSALDRFVDGDDIVKYSKLFEMIRNLR